MVRQVAVNHPVETLSRFESWLRSQDILIALNGKMRDIYS